MTYKEFLRWCNDRAFDGCWGMYEAIVCIERIEAIKKKPFFKREKEWNKLNEKFDIVSSIVEPTNKKIREIYA